MDIPQNDLLVATLRATPDSCMQRNGVPMVVKGESSVQSHSDLDGVGSIPAIPNARNVLSLLCHELFNESS